MTPPLTVLVFTSLAVVVNVIAQIAAYRLIGLAGRLFRSQLVGGLAGGGVLALLLVGGPADRFSADETTAGGLLYLTFCYVYFHWNNMGETARRIRMLRVLAAAPDGMTFDEMVARYSAREILERRLERLTTAGQIREVEGRLILNSRTVLASAQLVGLAKWIVFGDRCGLDEHDRVTL